MPPSTKLSPEFTRVRRAILLDQPFFGQLMLNLHVVEDPEADPIWVDGKELGYSVEKFAELPFAQAVGVTAKCVMHCAFEHHLRRANRNKEMWQEAADYVVNPIILESGMQLPPGAKVDAAYEGLSAEEVYEKLRQKAQQQQQQNQPQPQAGGGQGSNPGNSGSPNAPGQQQTQPGPSAAPPAGGGNAAPQQAPGTGGSGTGEVRDMPGQDGGGASAAEKSESASEWAVSTQQSMNNSESQGMLPAHLKRTMLEQLEPEVPWQDELRRFALRVTKSDLSWNKANRRFIGRGLYLPSAHSERLGILVAVIDTSGSIGQVQLAVFGGEVNGMIEDTRPERVIIIYCDAAVAHIDEFTADDCPIVLEPHGGGGTDFRPPFKWLEEQGITPDCLVYLTDMYGTFPEQEPDFPVLWAATTNRVGPFGDTLKVKEV